MDRNHLPKCARSCGAPHGAGQLERGVGREHHSSATGAPATALAPSHADRNDRRQRGLERRSWPRLHPYQTAQPAFAHADRNHVHLRLTTISHCPTGMRQHRPERRRGAGMPSYHAAAGHIPSTVECFSSAPHLLLTPMRWPLVVIGRNGLRRAQRWSLAAAPASTRLIDRESICQNRRPSKTPRQGRSARTICSARAPIVSYRRHAPPRLSAPR